MYEHDILQRLKFHIEVLRIVPWCHLWYSALTRTHSELVIEGRRLVRCSVVKNVALEAAIKFPTSETHSPRRFLSTSQSRMQMTTGLGGGFRDGVWSGQPRLQEVEDDLVRQAPANAHVDEQVSQQDDDEWRNSRVDDPSLTVSMTGMKTMVPLHRAITRTAEVRRCTGAHPCVITLLFGLRLSHWAANRLRARARFFDSTDGSRCLKKIVKDKYHLVQRFD